MPPHRRPLASTLGALLLAGLVVLAPLARGGVDPRVQLALAALAGLSLALAARGAGRAPLAGLALLGVVLAGALPLSVLLTGRSLSLDPPASGRDLASAVAALLAFWAAWAVAGTRSRRDHVVLGLALAGVAVAVAALGAALLGQGTLLNPTFPFVNPNHQSGLLNLSAFVLLGLALRRHGQARLLWLLAFVLVVAALFVTLSRGGIGAFFGGAAVFLALAAWRDEARPGEPAHRDWKKLAAAGLVVALGAVAYLALGPVLRELATLKGAGDEVKLDLWRPAAQLLAQHPWLGIGRGAFATVFTAYKTDPGFVTFTHLENEWLQPLIDLGLPAGLLLVGTLGVTWLAAARRRDLSSVEVGLLAGTAAVAAQNAVDFSLEFCGVGIPFLVALGLLTRGGRGVRLPWPALAVGTAALVALAGAGTWLWYQHPTDDDARAVAQAPSAALAEVAAREAARWHPADYLPPATAGARWVREGRCAPAMPWLTKAMALDPTAPEPHQYAARCLAAAGQDVVARREYRLALLFGSPDALAEAAARYPALDDLFQVVPDTGDGLLALGWLLLSKQRPADAAQAFRRALDGALDDRALTPLAGALLAAGDLDGALDASQRRTREKPTDPEGWRIMAQVLLAEGYDDEARQALTQGLEAVPGSPPLVQALVQRSLAAHRPAEARRIAESMAARTPNELALRELLVAATMSAEGRTGEAIQRARSAAGLLPDSTWPLGALASYCEQAGRYDDAIAAAERAATLAGEAGRAPWDERVAKLKAARAAATDRRGREELLKGR